MKGINHKTHPCPYCEKGADNPTKEQFDEHMKLHNKRILCQFCEEPIKEKDLGGVFRLNGKTVFFHDFAQCLLALKIELQLAGNTVEEVAFHLDLCERCGSNHKTEDCVKYHSRPVRL
jgi:hypothetical protein